MFKKIICLAVVLILVSSLFSCVSLNREETTQVTVTFDTRGGSEVSSQIIDKGSVATRPSPSPYKDNYIVVGWYEDYELIQAFDFDTLICQDITLFARWVLIPTEFLDPYIEEQIQQCIHRYFFWGDSPGTILRYYGTFEDWTVVMIQIFDYRLRQIEVISGISFFHRLYTGTAIYTWNNGVLLPLYETYAEGHLTRANLRQIADRHNFWNKLVGIDFETGHVSELVLIGSRVPIVRSLDEWDMVVTAPSSQHQLIERYNYQFFYKKALIVYIIRTPTMGNHVKVVCVSKGADKLLIEIDIRRGLSDAISFVSIIIEVCQSDIVDIDNVRLRTTEIWS